MTDKKKNELLKGLKQNSMTREELETYCSGQKAFDRMREIDSLCTEKLIEMVSEPQMNYGIFVPQPNDLFGLTDQGIDYLSGLTKERIRFWFPVIISIFATLIALGSLIVSIFALNHVS